jgi:hypothetical protein
MKKLIIIFLLIASTAWGFEIKRAGNYLNGNTSQTGVLATNSILNGTFDTDVSWSKGTGWAIDTGDSNNAIATATTGNLNETSSTIVAGKYYVLGFDATVTSGTFQILAGGWTSDTISASVTGALRYFYATTTGAVTFDGVTSFTGTIDNVTLQEVSATSMFDNIAFGTTETRQPLIFKRTLNRATGNQIAVHFVYQTNKATSGNDTGMLIEMLDTASPGTSLGIDYQVGGSSKFSVDNTGKVIGSAGGKFNNVSVGSSPAAQSGLAGGGGHILNLGNIASDPMSFTPATNVLTTGTVIGVKIIPTYNQTSGDAANTDFLINRAETAIGSGAQYIAQFQVGGNNLEMLTNRGHHIIDDAVATCFPALTSCGSSPVLSAGSNDHAGMFTIGSTGTGCIATFGTAYTNIPSCVVTAETVANLTSYTLSATAITIVGLPGNFHYNCTGLNGGI